MSHPSSSASILGSTDLRIANTAPAAFEAEVVEMFDALRNPVLRYLMSLGLPIQDSEEIVQETFLALFQHLRAGKARDNLRGWIFRVAHNMGLKRREKARRHGDEDASVADPSPDPEAQFAHSERQRRLRSVLHALPEQDQACLYLRAEGLRYREIAQVLGMSLGAISLSLTRSMTRMVRATGGDSLEI